MKNLYPGRVTESSARRHRFIGGAPVGVTLSSVVASPFHLEKRTGSAIYSAAHVCPWHHRVIAGPMVAGTSVVSEGQPDMAPATMTKASAISGNPRNHVGILTAPINCH